MYNRRPAIHWTAIGLGLAVALSGAPALAAAPSCPPGRFFLENGARVLPAGEDVAIDTVVVDASGAISIASGCPPVPAKLKKRGKLRAKWPAGSCTGVPGKAKLSARFATGCGALTGTFSAKKLKTRFTATRSDGVLLEGDPSSPALPALFDLPPQPAAPGDLVGGLILTRLDVGLAADATVGQVNAALTAVGGRIVAMRAGLPAAAVSVPRQDGPDGLRAIADALEALPGIRVALLTEEASLDEAPTAPADADAAIRYLQDARFPAAWNARAAAGDCADKVNVIVADKFHRPIDALYAGFASQVPGATDLGTGSVAAADVGGFHGYDVLTTLAAKLDATVPTGANPFPECLKVKAVQIERLTPFETSSAIDDALLATSGTTIVNASYGFNDGCGAPGAACTAANVTAPRAFARATWAAWQRRLLQPDVDQVLVTSAAGNEADQPVAALYPGTGRAEYNSALNLAATADSAMSFVSDDALWEPTSSCQPVAFPCPSLTATPDEEDNLAVILADLQQAFAPSASNVMIVGSGTSPGNSPSPFSDPGAEVLAIGEAIPTLRGTPTSGTSFAAPQVAGLAAYLWMLSPELRARPVRDTIDAIASNARFPSGLIDAYATVLSLDLSAEVTPATAKIRLAILDLDPDGPTGPTLPDGDFDETDLQAFHDAYVDSGLVLEPTVQDLSRHDLNGDGFTGGSRTSDFDLDPTGSTQFGAPTLIDATVVVGQEERTFDEQAVTDADVLCYYANTPLYSGDPAERDTLLSDLGCGSLDLPVFAGTVTETFAGTDGVATASSTETYDVVLESKPDGGFETTGSAHLLAVLDRNCQPGASHQVLDASATDPPDTMRDRGVGFAVVIEADIEGTNTAIGSDSCEENFAQPFDTTIRTDLPSEPEFVGGRVVALVWDAEVEAVDPFGFQIPGTLRVTGRLERVD